MTQALLGAQRFTAPQAAQILGVPTHTLSKWRSAKTCPVYVRLGKRVWYFEHDIDEFMRPMENLLRRASEEQEGPKGLVYFIQGEGIPLVKIGFADSVERRLGELQVGSPVPLSVLACLPGSQRTEAFLHKAFESHWVRGEWFRLDPNLSHFIDLVKASRQ